MSIRFVLQPGGRAGSAGIQKWLYSLPIVLPVAWVLVASGPELFRDRIYPFDSALFAANGALFYSMIHDLAGFLRAPVDWLLGYYNQYPALFMRRHPPLFGIVEGIVYSFTGVSVFGAKLTVLLFGVVFAGATYLLALHLWKDRLLALTASLIIVTTPLIGGLFRSVWLDIPTLASALMAFVFYARRLDTGVRDWRGLVPVALFAMLSFYTYQLSVFLLAGLALHLIATERGRLITDRPTLALGLVFVALLLPLVVFSIYFGGENVLAVSGTVPEGWARFVPVDDKWSIVYWTYYAQMFIERFPIQTAGLAAWLAFTTRRRPTSQEWLIVISLVTTYIGFSWIPSKFPRYAVYIAVPASFLAAVGFRRVIEVLVHRTAAQRNAFLGVGLVGIVVAQIVLVSARPHDYYLSNMHEPVNAILSARPNAKILYSGRNDAAFVFYVREADTIRRARVYRATAQLEDPRSLRTFVEDKGIDFIVFETNAVERDMSIYAEFRTAIEALVKEGNQYDLKGKFDLPIGTYQQEGTVSMLVYGRGGV